MIMLRGQRHRATLTAGWSRRGLIAAFIAWRIYIGTVAGRLWWDRARLSFPCWAMRC